MPIKEGDSEFLFVYGSLMSAYDHPLSDFLSENAQLISEAKVRGRLYKIEWYPGLVCDENSAEWVYGEVYQLQNSNIFKVLDEYEGVTGHPSDPYLRRIVTTQNEKGPSYNAWTYEYVHEVDETNKIEGGKYLSIIP